MDFSRWTPDPAGDTVLILKSPKIEASPWRSLILEEENPMMDANLKRAQKKKEAEEEQKATEILNESVVEDGLVAETTPVAEAGIIAELEITSEGEPTRHDKVVAGSQKADPHPKPLPYGWQYAPDGEPNEVRLRVSSRHLCLASEIFRKMLEGSWAESNRNSDSLYEICTYEWDAVALRIVMNIIHGHHRLVPSDLSLEKLSEIALIVDYYRFHEVVEIFAKSYWLPQLESSLPTEWSNGEDCITWIFLSATFSLKEAFEKMIKLALQNVTDPIETDLPVSPVILDAIEHRRVTVISQLYDSLDTLQQSFYGEGSCSNKGCSSMLLGSLLRGLHSVGLAADMRPNTPFNGQSLDLLNGLLSTISNSTWYENSRHWHPCTLVDRIKPALDELDKCAQNAGSEIFAQIATF